MQDKQKVTLYLPPSLHRKLKIRAAVESEAMSSLVEKAVAFYMEHPEVVEEFESSCGRTHRVYHCPACETPAVLREGEMVALGDRPGILEDEPLSLSKARSLESESSPEQGEEELVPC